MRPVLFGCTGSGSIAIEMALLACNVDYEFIRAASWEPESRYAELLDVNALGQIPTLKLDDGTVLTESAAILIHLGLQYPESGLLPQESSLQAQHIRGLVFIAANCYAAVSIGDFPEKWTTSKTKVHQNEVRTAAREKLHGFWSIFADTFNHLLIAQEPGALAFLAVVVSQWSGSRANLKKHRPQLHQTILELETHPRLVATLKKDRAP